MNFSKSLIKGSLIFIIYLTIVNLGEYIAKTYIRFVVYTENLTSGKTLSETQLNSLVDDNYYKYSFIFITLSALVMFILLFIYVKYKKLKFYEEINFRSINKSIIPYVILSAISIVVIQHVISFMIYSHIPESRTYFEQSILNIRHYKSSLLSFIPIMLLTPIVEEVFFRGIMLAKFKNGMPIIIAILLETILYTICTFNYGVVFISIIISIITCIISLKGKSILGAIIFHFVFNITYMFDFMPLMTDENWNLFSTVIFPIALIVFVISIVMICIIKPSKRIRIKTKFS